ASRRRRWRPRCQRCRFNCWWRTRSSMGSQRPLAAASSRWRPGSRAGSCASKSPTPAACGRRPAAVAWVWPTCVHNSSAWTRPGRWCSRKRALESWLARRELATLLDAHADVECVGEADDVPSGVDLLRRTRPDLLLLDIQMPSGTGFDLLDALDAAPHVVFTTAYDQHAVRAFEANALDYLVKPVAPERLSSALHRVRERLARPDLAHWARRPRKRVGAADRVFLREGERCWFVTLGGVDRIVVEGNSARLWFRGEKVFLQRSLAAL